MDRIFTPLAQISTLESITFSKTNILQLPNAAKSLSNIITNLKKLEHLSLRDGVLANTQNAKEIADGLMRAKQLRIIDVSSNTNIGT